MSKKRPTDRAPSKPVIAHPHDALFRAVFSESENIVGELQTVLPEGLSARIDWNTLRREPGSYVDQELVGRHTDLLFSASLRGTGRRAFLYVLTEAQSEPDAFMALRLLGYMVRIWEDFRRTDPTALRLPAIIPVVVHHGQGGWRAATHFAELLDLEPAEYDVLGDYSPDFEFVLDDLAHVSDEALRDRMTVTTYARLTLVFLKHARAGGRLLENFHFFQALLRELLHSQRGRADLGSLVRYYLAVNEGATEPLRKALAESVGPEASEVVMTIAEALEKKGKTEGKAEAVLAFLAARGLTVSAEQRARILGCQDLTLIEQWVTRAATATSPDELFVH